MVSNLNIITNIGHSEHLRINRFILLIYTVWLVAMGGALKNFNSHSLQISTPQGLILLFCLFSFVLITKVRFQNLKPLWTVCGFLLIWQILLIVKFKGYDILLGRLYDVIFAFILIRALGLKKMLYYYEIAVSKLCLLSLVIWGIIVIIPQIKSIIIPLSFPINETGTIVASWGVFGISNSENLGLLRNLGFAWEPGRFSSFVALALLFHLYRVRFQLFKKNFWPLVLALFSSLSTTGYIALSVCILGYFLNANKAGISQIVKYILLIGFILFFVASPFMWDKIVSVSDTSNFLTESVADYYGSVDRAYVPQRSEGLYWEVLNIVHDPLLGYGDNVDYSYVQRDLFPQLTIRLSNGILQIISMLGIPLAILFYLMLYKSSKYIALMYDVKGNLVLFFMICVINVSYNFFYEPFIMAIILYCVFLPATDKELILQKKYGKACVCSTTVQI